MKARELKFGIAIDDWKLPVFEKHLTDAGMKYEVGNGITAGCLTIYLFSDSQDRVVQIVKAANEAARAAGKPPEGTN